MLFHWPGHKYPEPSPTFALKSPNGEYDTFILASKTPLAYVTLSLASRSPMAVGILVHI